MIIRKITPNPLKGAFRVCAFDGCAKAKSPLGDLGVILRIVILLFHFSGFSDGEDTKNL
jgi:hypothetical protein